MKDPARDSWQSALLLGTLNALLIGVAFVAGFLAHSLLNANGVQVPLVDRAPFALLNETRGLLAARFIRPLPDDRTLEYAAIRGMVSAAGDPYTVFVDPPAHELQTQSLAGEFGGIGVGIAQNAAGEVVLDPFRDSPADQAGLQTGDVLLQVDEHPITPTMPLDAVTVLVRGEIGTTVNITVRQTTGQTLTVAIVRQRVEIPSADWEMLPDHPTIGLIRLNRFSDKTPKEVERALQELTTQGATRLVLDLRGNGGGILESAIGVAEQFLDGGVVMYETQRDAPEKVFSAPANTGPGTSLPLVILVNGNTASAAEIVAGALLDRNRAPLVGQKTYGKGSVQLVYELSDKSSLHVTAYLWFTPARRELDGKGIIPTYEIAPGTDGADPELAFAIQYLEGGN